MKNIDPIVAYLDETGDHSLENIDKDFPLFILTVCAAKTSIYQNEIIPMISGFKMKYFSHEGIILHSRDIRKAEYPFNILLNKSVREEFLNDLTSLMKSLNYRLIVSVIKKEELVKQYKTPYNPYDLGLTFALERLVVILEKMEQISLRVIAESRGKNEDDALRLSFFRIMSKGTTRVSIDRFCQRKIELIFVKKENNTIGTQLADLCGYPIGRYVLNPSKDNIPYEAIKNKIIEKVNSWSCFKIFP